MFMGYSGGCGDGAKRHNNIKLLYATYVQYGDRADTKKLTVFPKSSGISQESFSVGNERLETRLNAEYEGEAFFLAVAEGLLLRAICVAGLPLGVKVDGLGVNVGHAVGDASELAVQCAQTGNVLW